LIDKARSLHRQNKIDDETLADYSRNQEECISQSVNSNNQYIAKELGVIK